MCVVSMVGDHYKDIWKDTMWPNPGYTQISDGPTRAEFDELKRQVDEMVKLLKRAKIYDEENNQPDCEIEEKMDFLKKVAKLVGVDLDEVLSKK